MPEAPNTPILPEHINTSQHFWSAFDHHETEVSANLLVRFVQHRGEGWAPFNDEDINTYYQTSLGREAMFDFHRLGRMGWIRAESGMYHFTTNFIARCYSSAPADLPEESKEA